MVGRLCGSQAVPLGTQRRETRGLGAHLLSLAFPLPSRGGVTLENSAGDTDGQRRVCRLVGTRDRARFSFPSQRLPPGWSLGLREGTRTPGLAAERQLAALNTPRITLVSTAVPATDF